MEHNLCPTAAGGDIQTRRRRLDVNSLFAIVPLEESRHGAHRCEETYAAGHLMDHAAISPASTIEIGSRGNLDSFAMPLIQIQDPRVVDAREPFEQDWIGIVRSK